MAGDAVWIALCNGMMEVLCRLKLHGWMIRKYSG